MEDIQVAFTQQEFEDAIYAKLKMENMSHEINVSTKMLQNHKGKEELINTATDRLGPGQNLD